MTDAILYAVRDAILSAGLGYDPRTCEIMPDGHPKAECGDVFVAVHGGGMKSDMMNALNEYYGFDLTLTMKVSNVPPDRIGDRLLAKKMAETNGFNAKAHVLKTFLHMNWGVLQDANANLLARAAVTPNQGTIHGFCEPAMFQGMDAAGFQGGEWFSADPESALVGLAAELRFDGARRLQAIAEYV